MPLPTPRQNESRSEFVSRCLGILAEANEFESNEQRAAVCHSHYDTRRDMTVNTKLLKAIRDRDQKQTRHGYGIQTADKFVRTMLEMAGADICNQMASKNGMSFHDILQKSTETLTYSNPDMEVQEKEVSPDVLVGQSVELPKNTLMVFRHILTTPREDRDGDVLRTQGADPDPKMLLLWQHIHTLPIGKMLAIAEHNSEGLSLYSAIVDMNELSHDAAVMVDNKMGRFSHGFRALEYDSRKDEDGNEIYGFDIKRFEIMEESLVSVPSNIDAETNEVILSMVEGGKLTSAVLKEQARVLREKKPVTVVVSLPDLNKGEDDEESRTGQEEGTGSEEQETLPEETDANKPEEKETSDAEVIEEKEVSEEEEIEEEVEEKRITTYEALSVFLAKATRLERDHALVVLQALNNSEDQRQKGLRFRRLLSN